MSEIFNRLVFPLNFNRFCHPMTYISVQEKQERRYDNTLTKQIVSVTWGIRTSIFNHKVKFMCTRGLNPIGKAKLF